VKLPNADQAVVEPEKVRDYLLSPHHPIGKFKAAFFARLGYFQAQWEALADDLRSVASLHDALPGQPSQFGLKFEISAILTGPSGKSAHIVTVWMVRHGEQVARFVTATPGVKP
jgi:hypothetical protein